MIEINLLPGSVKKTKRRGTALSAGPLANLKMPQVDKPVAIAIGMWAVGLSLMAYLHLSSSGRLEQLTQDVAKARADSTRHALALETTIMLQGTMDTVARKVEVVQELDAGRYNWAHILDEIASNLPNYAWLINITFAESSDPKVPAFRITGRGGNAFALPAFIRALENSPFIMNVSLNSSDAVVENDKTLHQFIIDGSFEQPPIDMIQTVPLIGPGEGVDADSMTATPDSTPPAAKPAPAAAAPAKKGAR